MACSHQALSSSGGGGGVQVDFQEVDTAQDVNFSHLSPQRNNPLWHKKGRVGQARPRGKFNRRGLQRGASLAPKPQQRIQGQDTHAWLRASAQLQSCLLVKGPCTAMSGRNPRDYG